MSNKSNIYSHNTSGKNPVPQLSHKHGQPVEKPLVLLWLQKSPGPGLCLGSLFPALGGIYSSFTPFILAHSMLARWGVMSPALEELVGVPAGCHTGELIAN